MPELSYIEVETKPDPQVSVIWLHGLGADGSDFEPIVQELGLEELPGVRFIFPDAPFQPVTCNGGYVMRAWYDIVSLDPDSREIDEAGLIASIDIVRQLIAHETGRGIPSHRIFLAGFSQGGAVAYSAALTHPEPLAGIIALSTYIPSARLVTDNLSAANRNIPIFAAHGLEDSVVSIGLGEQAVALVERCGPSLHWRTYEMAHEVCLDEIRDISNWLHENMTASKGSQAVQGVVVQSYATVPADTTKDGSEIRELMHPQVHGNAAQSLAEACIPAGGKTLLHRHQQTEEIYHVTSGFGRMTLGEKTFPVKTGDTVLIPPGTPHCIEAIGGSALRILCCCAPAYSHADTELLDMT